MQNESSRREFFKLAAGAGALLALSTAGGAKLFGEEESPEADSSAETAKYGIVMANLPYEEAGLDPWISEKTVRLHYFKHHRGYYTMLRAFIHSHPEYQRQTVEQLILNNQGHVLLDETIFDIAVLLYNHNWYWPSLSPTGGGVPKGRVGELITAAYGSYDAFRAAFIDESMKLGVGWVWVVRDGEAVKVYRSEYHDTPLLRGFEPLLAVDVWEHAYYLDYENDRTKYVEAVLDHLINWTQAEKNLNAAISEK
jgi:Fe-Mn family superoxide dismutase